MQRHWVIDGNNVMGSRADGWWNDRVGSSARLAQEIAVWTRGHEDAAVLVFDCRPTREISVAAGGNLVVEFARRVKKDGADDRIVEIVEDLLARFATQPEIITVTSDKGLINRLPPGVEVVSSGRFIAGELSKDG